MVDSGVKGILRAEVLSLRVMVVGGEEVGGVSTCGFILVCISAINVEKDPHG